MDLAAVLTARRQQQREQEEESKAKLAARPTWDTTTSTPSNVRKVPPPRLNSRAPPPAMGKLRLKTKTNAAGRSPGSAWDALMESPASSMAGSEFGGWEPDADGVSAEELAEVRRGAAQAVRLDEQQLVERVNALRLRPSVAGALKGIRSRMLRRQAVHRHLFAWMEGDSGEAQGSGGGDDADAGSAVGASSDAAGFRTPRGNGVDGAGAASTADSWRSNGGSSVASGSPRPGRRTGSGLRRRPRRRKPKPRPGWDATTFVEPKRRALVHTLLKDDEMEVVQRPQKPPAALPDGLYTADVNDHLKLEVAQQLEDVEMLERSGYTPGRPRVVGVAPSCAYKRSTPGSARRVRGLPQDVAQAVAHVVRAAEAKDKEAAERELEKGAAPDAGTVGDGSSSVAGSVRSGRGRRQARQARAGTTSWERGSFFGTYSRGGVGEAARATAAEARSTPGSARRRRRRNYRESRIRPEDLANYNEYEARKGYDSGVRQGSIMEKSIVRRAREAQSHNVRAYIEGNIGGSEHDFLADLATAS